MFQSRLLLASYVLLIGLALCTPSLPGVVAASSGPNLFRPWFHVPDAVRVSDARGSVRQPSPLVYRFANVHWSNCGSKLPMTASDFNYTVQSGNVLASVIRFQLAVDLWSAVIVSNGTATINGTNYNFQSIDGIEDSLLDASFPLPAGRDVVFASQILYDGPPTYHVSGTSQFLDEQLNVVGCTHQDLDIIRQDAPGYHTAAADVYAQ